MAGDSGVDNPTAPPSILRLFANETGLVRRQDRRKRSRHLDAVTTDHAASEPREGAGRMDEAKAAVAEARRLSPKLTV